MRKVRISREEARRRQSRRVGAVGFLAALALPIVLFRNVIGLVARHFHLDVSYLSGWLPWALMALGLLFILPVALSAGRDPGSRWYPRSRRAYAGWGVTLYVLGFALATQVAQIVANGSGQA